jgi:hypothetical protein
MTRVCLLKLLEQFIITRVWVDDIIYFSKDSNFASEYKVQIEKRFTISDLSPLHWFLGMKLERSAGKIILSQRLVYIEGALLQKFGMTDCKPVTTPLAEHSALTRQDCPEDGSLERDEMKGNENPGSHR